MEKSGARSNGPRWSIPTVLSISLLCGSFLFLSLFEFELILNYWFSKRLHPDKIIYYSCAYLTIGSAFGLGIGIAHAFLERLKGKISEANPEALFVSLCSVSLIGFLVFLILNADYLPYASIFSPSVFMISALLLALCMPLSILLYSQAGGMDTSAPATLAMSVGASVGAVMTFFHAIIARAIGDGELGLLKAAGLSFAFLSVGALAASIDLKVTALIVGRRSRRGRTKSPLPILVTKILLAALVVFALILTRRYEPLVADGKKGGGAAASDKPNIIILVLDTVRRDRLSLYGNDRDTSPNIDEFAAESLVFDAYSPASWTLPSHAAIVTGLYPTESGTGAGRNYRIDPSNKTLAEILGENGYATAAVISNHMVLDHSSGFAQGFDSYYANPRETDPAFSFFASYILKKFHPAAPVFSFYPLRRAESINRIAMKWIETRNQAPFFLFVNYMEAHAPYVPPDPHGRKWLNDPAPAVFFGGAGIWKEFNLDVNASKRKVSEAEREYLLSQYDGEIAYLDAQIGSFLRELKSIGLYDNSLIVLTSDHGELFAEHGLIQHPRVLYQELIRTPLIVKLPENSARTPAKAPAAVSLVDLFHSILDYVGVPHETSHSETSIFEARTSPMFSEAHSMPGESSPEFLERFGDHLYSIVQDNYKLIYSSRQVYEFYDLSSDPLESLDLMKQSRPEEVDERLEGMKAELGVWINRIDANRLNVGELPAQDRSEIRTRLKALGYVQ